MYFSHVVVAKHLATSKDPKHMKPRLLIESTYLTSGFDPKKNQRFDIPHNVCPSYTESRIYNCFMLSTYTKEKSR